jgi:hypothetical protein
VDTGTPLGVSVVCRQGVYEGGGAGGDVHGWALREPTRGGGGTGMGEQLLWACSRHAAGRGVVLYRVKLCRQRAPGMDRQ